MKTCIKCKQEKLLSEFYNSKSYKDKKMGTCKACFNTVSSSNKVYRKKYNKIRNQYSNIKEYNKKWKQNNPEYHKQWYQNNKIKINEYQKSKKQKNSLYKISTCIRTRISQSISGYSKSRSTLDILGVKNFNEFKQYIESLFDNNMTWDNYGYGPNKWVIDHRKPLASATTEQEIYNLNHHTNLQPMWWSENMVKGAKII
jgi:hypothetical protein